MKRLRFSPFTPVSKLNNTLLDKLKRNDRSLKYLIFSSRDLGHRGVQAVSEALRANCSLEALDLSSNRIQAEGCIYIALLIKQQNSMKLSGGIKTLILGDNDIRDEGVKCIANALENNRVLESLWLDDNCIGCAGLDMLAHSLVKNDTLERLHLKHNSFQSLSPLLRCTFNKESLEAIADSNHT
jgi:Ran GTPase-activating protein (RanGAP) involved in mRNA processing and transport